MYTELSFVMGGKMRKYLSCLALCIGCLNLTACGQSGALQLPSDPNLDTRARYLIYAPTSQTNGSETSEQDVEQTPSVNTTP